MIRVDRLDEAATRLAGLINDEDFISKEGKSKHTVRLHMGILYIYMSVEPQTADTWYSVLDCDREDIF